MLFANFLFFVLMVFFSVKEFSLIRKKYYKDECHKAYCLYFPWGRKELDTTEQLN